MAGGFGTAELRLRDVTDVGPGSQRHAGSMLLPLGSFSFGLVPWKTQQEEWFHDNLYIVSALISVFRIQILAWEGAWGMFPSSPRMSLHTLHVQSPEVCITGMHGKFIWECHLFLVVTPSTAEALEDGVWQTAPKAHPPPPQKFRHCFYNFQWKSRSFSSSVLSLVRSEEISS